MSPCCSPGFCPWGFSKQFPDLWIFILHLCYCERTYLVLIQCPKVGVGVSSPGSLLFSDQWLAWSYYHTGPSKFLLCPGGVSEVCCDLSEYCGVLVTFLINVTGEGSVDCDHSSRMWSVMASGVWSSWPHCTHSQQAKRDKG